MPALLTTVSMRPNASIAACTIRCALSHDATLSPFAIARPPRLDYLFGHLVRDRALGGYTTEVHAEIVDDYGRSRLGEIQRYAASDATARARDQRDLPFHHAHVVPQ